MWYGDRCWFTVACMFVELYIFITFVTINPSSATRSNACIKSGLGHYGASRCPSTSTVLATKLDIISFSEVFDVDSIFIFTDQMAWLTWHCDNWKHSVTQIMNSQESNVKVCWLWMPVSQQAVLTIGYRRVFVCYVSENNIILHPCTCTVFDTYW